jgi:hypothetical protein
MWEKYYTEANAVIFVVDSSDISRLEEAKLAFGKSSVLLGVDLSLSLDLRPNVRGRVVDKVRDASDHLREQTRSLSLCSLTSCLLTPPPPPLSLLLLLLSQDSLSVGDLVINFHPQRLSADSHDTLAPTSGSSITGLDRPFVFGVSALTWSVPHCPSSCPIPTHPPDCVTVRV